MAVLTSTSAGGVAGRRNPPSRRTQEGPDEGLVGPKVTAARGRSDYWLLTVPPLVTVRFDVSWQLTAMSRWPLLVLSYSTDHA